MSYRYPRAKRPFKTDLTDNQLLDFIYRVQVHGRLVGSRAISVHSPDSDWDYVIKGWEFPEVDVAHLLNYASGEHPTVGFYLEAWGKVYNILFTLSIEEYTAWIKTQETWERMLDQSPVLHGLAREKPFRVATYQALRESYGLKAKGG